MTNSEDRLKDLDALKEKRKNGEIEVTAYYKALLDILAQTVVHLQDDDISEQNAKKQIPLILVFLEEQLAKLKSRGG